MRGGAAHYQLGKARLLVDEGAYAVLNEGRPYQVEVAPGVESFCLFFDATAVRGAWQALTNSTDHLLDLPDADSPVELVERRFEHDGLLSPLLARLRKGNLADTWTPEQWDDHMLEALHRLFRLQDRVQKEAEQISAARPQTRAELYRRLHRARDYLEASLNEPLDLEKAASAAHLSPFHFHRSFKDLFRVTPAQYIRRRRLERAEQLLRSTNLSVLEICHEVGFQSLGSFTTLFRRHTGHTPGVYRRAKTTEGN